MLKRGYFIGYTLLSTCIVGILVSFVSHLDSSSIVRSTLVWSKDDDVLRTEAADNSEDSKEEDDGALYGVDIQERLRVAVEGVSYKILFSFSVGGSIWFQAYKF
jgi:hypothetical protein